MTNLLAIDTATDALSLALRRDGETRALHRVMPRQHQQRLFACLSELLDGASPASMALDAIVFGRGPGSFTGLRIAASAAQGLAFSLSLPVLGVSSLETQARTLLRRESISAPCLIISTIDARIGQRYSNAFHFDGERLRALEEPRIVAAGDWSLPAAADDLSDLACHVVGSGAVGPSPGSAPRLAAASLWPDVLPEALDMLVPARELLATGTAGSAIDAVPDYVQPRVGWKTLAEQGRKA